MDYRLQVLRSIFPLIFVSRMFGVFPVTITEPNQVSVSKVGTIYGLCASLGTFIVVMFARLSPNQHRDTSNIILRICTILFPFVVHASSFSYVSRAGFISKSVQEMVYLSRIVSVESTFWFVVAQVSLSMTFFSFNFIAIYIIRPHLYGSPFFWLRRLSEFYIIAAIFLICLQMFNFLLFLSQVFRALNEKLLTVEFSKNAESVIIIYGRARRLCDLLTKAFGRSCVFIAAFALCSLVLCMYNFITESIPSSKFLLLAMAQILLQQWMVLYGFERVIDQVLESVD